MVVDLAEAPRAGRDGVDEASQIQHGETDQVRPCDGVADASIDGIRLVLSAAEVVGSQLAPGKASAQAGDASPDQNRGQPEEGAAVEAVLEQVEGERAGGDEEDENPDGPVREDR